MRRALRRVTSSAREPAHDRSIHPCHRVSITTHRADSPEVCGIRRISTAFTRPEVEAWTAEETLPSGPADQLALLDGLASLAKGCGGPPTLWCSGMTNSAGIGATAKKSAMASPSEASLL